MIAMDLWKTYPNYVHKQIGLHIFWKGYYTSTDNDLNGISMAAYYHDRLFITQSTDILYLKYHCSVI